MNRKPSTKRKAFYAFLSSILMHVALYFTILSFSSINILPTQREAKKVISAKLFYKSTKPKKTKMENKGKVKQKPLSKRHSAQIDNVDNTKSAIINTEKKVLKPTRRSKVASNNALKVKNEKAPIKKFDALNALQSLRNKIDNQSYSQSKKEAYNEYVENKNFIPRSTTKLNQQPEAKAIEVRVNCNNVLNESLTFISGMLGGSIKCISFNGSQKYIDARLEKLGKKKNKKK